MPAVRFFEEDLTYDLKNKLPIKRWIKDTITAEGFRLNNLSFILCSDAYLIGINRKYLNHDTYTDIITFDNSSKRGVVEGDIFISVERTRENASQLNVPETDELHRVIIHGTLHLMGYKDKSKADKAKMTEKEDFYLNARTFNK